MKRFLITSMALAAYALPASATDFDFSGSFTEDNDIALFSFTVGAPSTVTIFSSSWLYGNPPPGGPNGGFDPILAIWDSTGALVAQQDDGGVVGSTLSNGTAYSHGSWDSYYSVLLAAGTYKASVAQYDNFAAGSNLSAGFIHDGNPNFTFDNGYGGATQPFFNGVWDTSDPRTGAFAFHILNVDSASGGVVPDAASTLGLLSLSLAGLGFVRRKLQA